MVEKLKNHNNSQFFRIRVFSHVITVITSNLSVFLEGQSKRALHFEVKFTFSRFDKLKQKLKLKI